MRKRYKDRDGDLWRETARESDVYAMYERVSGPSPASSFRDYTMEELREYYGPLTLLTRIPKRCVWQDNGGDFWVEAARGAGKYFLRSQDGSYHGTSGHSLEHIQWLGPHSRVRGSVARKLRREFR